MSEQPKQNSNRKRNRNRNGNSSWKDLKPQFLHTNVVESAANTFTKVMTNTPCVFHALPGNKQLVMEILKIFADVAPELVAGTATQSTIGVSTKALTADPGFNNDVIIRDSVLVNTLGARTAESHGVFSRQKLLVYDLTDGAGNGILVAAPQLCFFVMGAANVNAKNVNFKVLYRLLTVSSEELLGMLQSA